MRIIEPFNKGRHGLLMRIIEPSWRIAESLFKRINGIHYRLISYPVYRMNEGLHFCMLEGDGILQSWVKFFYRYSFKLHPYGSIITIFVKDSFTKL